MLRTLLLALCAVLTFSPQARAATITWFAENELTYVSPSADFWVGPGLTVGTPWSLTVSFDPSAPPVGSTMPGCNIYSIGSSTLTLGAYSYSHSGGQIFTNAALPAIGCIGMVPEGNAGLIQFWYGNNGWESDDPDAFRLSTLGGVTFAGYYDQLVKDGTLPTVPTFDPLQGIYGEMQIENGAGPGILVQGGEARFELLDEQPTPVPEPATMTLFGAGLAAAIARRRFRP